MVLFYIFELNSNILSLVERKYSSKLDIFSLVYSYICVRNIGFLYTGIFIKSLSKHVLPSLMEALFNVPAQSVLPNRVRSDKTQVHVNQVLLPVSY